MNWVLANLDVVGRHTVSHLVLALPPIVLSLLLAVPLGWLANRVRWLRTPLLTGAGLFYAIPSLPLFVVLPVVIGTGIRDPLNIIIALTLYGLALLVPVAADALRQVDARALDAADAMGYPAVRRFLAVDLPLAGPALLAGLRVVAVTHRPDGRLVDALPIGHVGGVVRGGRADPSYGGGCPGAGGIGSRRWRVLPGRAGARGAHRARPYTSRW